MPGKNVKKKNKGKLAIDLNCDIDVQPHLLPVIEVNNVVSTFDVGVNKLPLKEIAQKYSFCEYQPSRFAALTARVVMKNFDNHRTTALAFASGRLVCTGSRSVCMCLLAARRYVRLFQRLGYTDLSFCDFSIQNIVSSVHLGFPLKLEEMALDYGPYCSYEPDLFPGLSLRTSSLVFLCFRSGKCVITGGQNMKNIKKVFVHIYYKILKCYEDTVDLNTSSSDYRNSSKRRRMLLNM